jgi:hypothetical protein
VRKIFFQFFQKYFFTQINDNQLVKAFLKNISPQYPAKIGSMYCKEPSCAIIFAPPTKETKKFERAERY